MGRCECDQNKEQGSETLQNVVLAEHMVSIRAKLPSLISDGLYFYKKNHYPLIFTDPINLVLT